MDETSMNEFPNRPWPLAIFLTLALIGLIYLIWHLLDLLITGRTVARWFLLIPLVICLAKFIASLAVFCWRRWGVYLWVACSAAAGFLATFAYPNLGMLFKFLVPTVVFLLCVIPVWENFE